MNLFKEPTINLQEVLDKENVGYAFYLKWANPRMSFDRCYRREMSRVVFRGLLGHFMYDNSIYMCSWFNKTMMFDLFIEDDNQLVQAAILQFFHHVGKEYGKAT